MLFISTTFINKNDIIQAYKKLKTKLDFYAVSQNQTLSSKKLH